jgi:O-antigen ligase
MMQLFIIIIALNWIIEGDFKNKFRVLFTSRPALIFIAFFLLHLIGMIYTKNVDSGLFDIQVKLTLLLFPLIYVSRPIHRRQMYFVFYSLITGCIVVSLIMLARAFSIYNDTGENQFFYEQFSFLGHPGYLSMFMNVAIAWLVLGMLEKNRPFKAMPRFWAALIVAFLSVIIVLLSSKLGILTLFLIFLGAAIYYILDRKKYLIGFSAILALVLSVSALLYFVPEISARVTRAVTVLTSESTDVQDAESTAVRLLVWKASNEIIARNPFIGVGTGDTKDELLEEYKKDGMTGALSNNLNCHNAYYQVFVSLGLIGFLLFILHLLAPLRIAYRRKNTIYVLFLLIVMFNFLTESMLERQTGVLFFALFNSLLCFTVTDDEAHLENIS